MPGASAKGRLAPRPMPRPTAALSSAETSPPLCIAGSSAAATADAIVSAAAAAAGGGPPRAGDRASRDSSDAFVVKDTAVRARSVPDVDAALAPVPGLPLRGSAGTAGGAPGVGGFRSSTWPCSVARLSLIHI